MGLLSIGYFLPKLSVILLSRSVDLVEECHGERHAQELWRKETVHLNSTNRYEVLKQLTHYQVFPETLCDAFDVEAFRSVGLFADTQTRT